MKSITFILFFFLSLQGPVFAFSILENTTHSKIEFGIWIDLTTLTYSDNSIHSKVLEFKTQEDKHSYDLKIKHHSDLIDLSVKLYDEIDGMLLWSNENIFSENEFKVSWVNLLADKDYFIVVENIGDKELALSLEMNALTLPPNDLCEDAEELFGGEIFCDAFFQVFEDNCATPDPEATGNCVDPTEPGRWYTFTTPDPMPFNNFWFGYSPSAFEIFSTTTDCSGLVYEDCGGVFSFSPEPGTTYYILVGTNMTISVDAIDIIIACDDPLTFFDMGPGISEAWGATDCLDPSSIMPCQNDHVVWYSYDTGCETSDITIQVEEHTTSWGDPSADDLSITVILDDCSTLMTDYDINGLGYLCDALTTGNIMSLENVPPGTSFIIGIGSESNEVGNFWLTLNEENDGSVGNDFCDDLIDVFDGGNFGFSNLCASSDIDIPTCFGQSNNTVWFQYDAGPDPVDLQINVVPDDISSPAIAALDGCSGSFIDQDCNGNLILECVSGLFILEVGSSSSNAGGFGLEITSSPALIPPDPDITTTDICSEANQEINISFPSGEIVDLTVSISPSSSSSINGMAGLQFSGVNSIDITDILTNNSSTPELAVYSISVGGNNFTCPAQPIEFSFLVFPEFNLIPQSFEGCAPFNLSITAPELIQGGTAPYSSYQWIWNGFDVLSDDDFLNYDFTEDGLLTLEIIDANNCTTFNDIPLTITPALEASFDFPLIYCRSEQEFIDLPTTSLEGIEGNWTPAIIELEFEPDGFIDLVFDPLDPMCNMGVSYEIEIYSGDQVEFNLPSIICSNEDLYVFPSTSDDGLNGFWDFPSIDLSTVSGSMINYFTVNAADCYEIYEYEFEVGDEYEISFDIPDQLCYNTPDFTLPLFSLEGFSGNWSIQEFNQLNIVNNNFTTTWTPDPGQSDCLGPLTLFFDIPSILQPMFNLPEELCQNDPTLVLPTMTLNQNLEGSWNMDAIDPSLLSGTVMLQFTPDDPACVTTFESSIEILPSTIPSFNIDTTICETADLIILQTTSVNNISGMWSLPEIDPSLYQGQQVESTFVPDESQPCTENITLTFQVQTAQIPLWNIDNLICADSEDLVLPTISDNGISGNWSTPIINVEDNLGASVLAEFIPDELCVQASSITFEVLEPYGVTAQGMDPTDCDTENGMITLITSSTNLEYSIDGGLTWQSEFVFQQLTAGFYNILIRSQVYLACIEMVELSLSANEAPMVENFMVTDVSSCLDQTGSLSVEATGNNLEYSIDGGMTWQSTGLFENLSAGDYTIEIRQDGSSECSLELLANIQGVVDTEIIQINPNMLTDCGTNDGIIDIIASGDNLQYSIDGGLNFSNDNIFQGLEAGVYSIIVQSQIILDCQATESITIEAPNAPSIINTFGTDPTDCSPNVGVIEVEAEGNNLQYSIDNGASWQDDSVFINLSAGNYNILVQDALNTNCIDEIDYVLVQLNESIAEPQLSISPLSECNATDAVLMIPQSNFDLEFSLDNGMTWQSQNSFTGLSAGSYSLIIRLVDLIDCNVTLDFEIDNPDCPCNDLQLDLMVNNVDCNSIADPFIDLSNIVGMENSDIEILWDHGDNSSIVLDVADGWYYVTIFYDDICEWRDSVIVEIETPITFEWSIIDTDCAEASNGAIQVFNIEGGNGEYLFSIGGNSFQEQAEFLNLNTGQYNIQVMDTNGCVQEESVAIESLVTLNIGIPEILIATADQITTLDPQIQASEIDSFQWTSTDEILNPGELIAQVSPDTTTSYLLEVYYGVCVESHEVLIEIIEEESGGDIFINNVFALSDPLNNTLFPQAASTLNLVVNSLSIFDRWGNQLFLSENIEINNAATGWNGLYQNEKVNPGVYVYKLDYQKNGEVLIKVGSITVLD